MEHSPQSSALNEAHKAINSERQDMYGDPEDSFGTISRYWTTYLISRFPEISHSLFVLSKLDVAHMMALSKIARMCGQKSCRDNYVDSIGYLAIAADRLLSSDTDRSEQDTEQKELSAFQVRPDCIPNYLKCDKCSDGVYKYFDDFDYYICDKCKHRLTRIQIAERQR